MLIDLDAALLDAYGHCGDFHPVQCNLQSVLWSPGAVLCALASNSADFFPAESEFTRNFPCQSGQQRSVAVDDVMMHLSR